MLIGRVPWASSPPQLPIPAAGDRDIQSLVELLRAMSPSERSSQTGRWLASVAYSDLHAALLRRPAIEGVYRFARPSAEDT